ncbi:MAG TPA: DUF881 domain-containing protein [Mycobacteriales bacterium]|jgi:uncharacterized protein YlxW (UPF0749 family)|nr:DUF881 domain-containing protein [Mycobacteriales bacterium]
MSPWRLAVPAVVLGAGVLFATSAETAHGTDLRAGRRLELTQLIGERDQEVRRNEARAAGLRAAVERSTRQQSGDDARIAAAQTGADRLRGPAGLSAVAGPALTVELNDAPPRPGGQLPAGATVNDIVVHQQDVQAVVNALWAGGAEAMTIMGQRVIATGAVRCVGNTLLLYGRTYSPPFRVTAIGPADMMRASLQASRSVQAFRQAVKDFNLGYHVTDEGDVRMPGYTGQVSLPHTTGTQQ